MLDAGPDADPSRRARGVITMPSRGMASDHVDYVRRLWRAYERQGLDAMLALTPPDVVWEPLRGSGRLLRTHDELRAYFNEHERAGRSQEARVYTFEPVGDHVLVAGSLRDVEPHGFRESQPTWVYFFRDGRLVRAVGYQSETEARAAMEAWE
jgi:ketosteroid isomerase-like protein